MSGKSSPYCKQRHVCLCNDLDRMGQAKAWRSLVASRSGSAPAAVANTVSFHKTTILGLSISITFVRKSTVDQRCWGIWHFAVAGCSLYKGPNLAGHDPLTDKLERLFNPRTDNWTEHFYWIGARLHGRTGIGRVTIEVLRINDDLRVAHRRLLAEFKS
jgi:hypothetical protein